LPRIKLPLVFRNGADSERTVKRLISWLFLILVAVVIGILLAWWRIPQTTTMLAVLAVILGGGAFLLTVAAALVAVLAYEGVIAKPKLRAEVRFGHGMPPMTLRFDPPNEHGYRRISQFIQCDAHVHLFNDSTSVSALNPAVKVQLYGLGSLRTEQLDGWSGGNHRNGIGLTSAQWDGGANYSIHPNWAREFPILKLYVDSPRSGHLEVGTAWWSLSPQLCRNRPKRCRHLSRRGRRHGAGSRLSQPATGWSARYLTVGVRPESGERDGRRRRNHQQR
jgi:hypothetical protein